MKTKLNFWVCVKNEKYFFFLSFCQVYFIKLTSETVIILVANLNLNSLAENSVKPCSLVLSQLLHKRIWKEYIYSYFLPILCTWNQWLISCSRDFYLLWKYEKKKNSAVFYNSSLYTWMTFNCFVPWLLLEKHCCWRTLSLLRCHTKRR